MASWKNEDEIDCNIRADQNKTLVNFFSDSMNNDELDPFRLNSLKSDDDCEISDPFSTDTLKVELQEVQEEKSLEDPSTRFTYAINTPLSLLTKCGESNITYLNKSQVYEMTIKCHNPAMYNGQLIESNILLRFQETRFHSKEREQFEGWNNQYNMRIIEAVTESCTNVESVTNDTLNLNSIHIVWKPCNVCSIFLKVNCLSGDFTKRRHSGEKGVPFLISVDTYLYSYDHPSEYLYTAACIVKIFQNKGAERKHRNDSKQISKLSEEEKAKLCSTSEVTQLRPIIKTPDLEGPSCSSYYSDSYNGSSYCADNSRLSDNYSDPENELNSPKKPCIGGTYCDMRDSATLTSQASVYDTLRWLRTNRFNNHIRTFNNYSGYDLLRLSRQDLKDLIGATDGIRLHNALQNKTISAKMCLYVQMEGAKNSVYQAIYLEVLNYLELVANICSAFNVDPNTIVAVQKSGPKGINICVTDDVVRHLETDTCFCCSLIPTDHKDKFVLSLRQS